MEVTQPKTGGHPTEDHHENTVFLGEIIVVTVLGCVGSCYVERLVLHFTTEEVLHEVAVL
jgi:hypothetical protein